MLGSKWWLPMILGAAAIAVVCGVEVNRSGAGSIVLRAVETSSQLLFRNDNGASDRKHMVETMGSGAAVLDFDGDGLLDIYLVNGGAVVDGKVTGHAGKLFRNIGGGRFVDVTEGSGIRTADSYGMGVAVGDYDNDGLPDLYITGYPRSYLFRNRGHGHFEDVTASTAAGDSGWSTSAAFLDYNRDGLLDLYVGRYVKYDPAREPYCGIKKDGWRSYCLPDVFEGESGVLLKNTGNGHFVDATAEAALNMREAKTLGVSVGDYDRDGYPDLDPAIR